MTTFQIDGRPIGPGHPPYVIAEISANHLGNIGKALALIEQAKSCGCDAVKLQTYTADTMTIDCGRADFRITGGPWDGYTLYRLYQEAHTPWSWHGELFARARALGLSVFSTPFDPTAVDFLEGLRAPAYKIASFELADLPLIAKAASTGKPLILSTGMASQEEIGVAVDTARRAGCRELALLHCVSGYPAPVEDFNLTAMMPLANRYGVVVGLSDHSLGSVTATTAVALGASIIEKHFTASRSEGGPDAGFSAEPSEMTELVANCNLAWRALGTSERKRRASEEANAVFRRSLYVVTDIAKGEPFTAGNLRAIRPGFGLPPGEIARVLGRPAARNILRGEPLRDSDIG